MTSGHTSEKNDLTHSSKSSMTAQGVNILARMPEFHLLSKKDVEQLAVHGPRVYKSGEIILFSGNDDVKGIVALLAGSCKILVTLETRGKRFSTFIETINAPAVLGEVTAFASPNQFRQVDVVAAQRCLALHIPAETLTEQFKKSKATLPRMMLTFAELGAARVRGTLNNFNKLFDHYTKGSHIKRLDIGSALSDLESIFIPGKGSAVNEFTFDTISNLLNRVNIALASVSHFHHMPDYFMPEGINQYAHYSPHLSRLSVMAMENEANVGKTIKHSLTTALATFTAENGAGMDWNDALEEMTISLEEITALMNMKYNVDERRRTFEGSENMIEGFAARMENEFNAIEADTLKRFGLQFMPSETDHEGVDRVLPYVKMRTRNIVIRQFTGGNDEGQEEYSGQDSSRLLDHVAMEIFYRLSNHPVIRVITVRMCEGKWNCKPESEDEELNIFNLFCRGCKLVYPKIKEDPGTLLV